MSTNDTIKQKKQIASFAVLGATRTNLLPHISEVRCHDCSKPAAHYHHEDYDKPLAVIPLCAQCHSDRHNKETKEQYQVDAAAIFQRENNTSNDNSTQPPCKLETLEERTKIEIAKHGTILALSKAINVNPGVIYRAQHGGNSPTLRRLWKVPKHPQRSRVIFSAPAATVYRFNSMRGDTPPAEFLEGLMDLFEGIGDLP